MFVIHYQRYEVVRTNAVRAEPHQSAASRKRPLFLLTQRLLQRTCFVVAQSHAIMSVCRRPNWRPSRKKIIKNKCVKGVEGSVRACVTMASPIQIPYTVAVLVKQQTLNLEKYERFIQFLKRYLDFWCPQFDCFVLFSSKCVLCIWRAASLNCCSASVSRCEIRLTKTLGHGRNLVTARLQGASSICRTELLR